MNTIPVSCGEIYKQKKKNALYYKPPARLNLVSPYVYLTGASKPIFSQFQLNMRRKVEILKYANSDTKQNNYTNAQMYSTLANGNGRLSQYHIQNYNATQKCNSDLYLPTPNSACDVPGPLMYLQNDPTVPLYNYKGVSDRTMSLLPPSAPYQYNVITKNEILYLNSINNTILPDNANSIDNNGNIIKMTYETDLGVLIIGTLLTSGNYTFSLSCPLGFWITGYINQRSANNASNSNIKVTITKITLQVYYNQTIIIKNGIQVYPSLSNNTLSVVSFDVSKLNKSSTTNFYAIQYIGTVNLTNITLPVQPGYIYELKLQIEYSYDSTNLNPKSTSSNTINTTKGTVQTGIFSNLSSDNINVLYNAELTSTGTTFVPGSFELYTTTSAF